MHTNVYKFGFGDRMLGRWHEGIQEGKQKIEAIKTNVNTRHKKTNELHLDLD